VSVVRGGECWLKGSSYHNLIVEKLRRSVVFLSLSTNDDEYERLPSTIGAYDPRRAHCLFPAT
jgi:hypothetical protein